MKRLGALIVALIFLLSGCGKKAEVPKRVENNIVEKSDMVNTDNKNLENDTKSEDSEYEIEMKMDLFSLMMAYPEFIKGIEAKGRDNAYIVMKSGRKILYDDKKNKSFEEKMANADLQDMMEQSYPLEHITKIMDKNHDPGRIRSYSLFNEIYGDSKGKIEKNLSGVSANGINCRFNKSNGASEALKKSFNEALTLAKSNKRASAILYPISGTYNYRVISGTNQLSAHAYGIAVDLKSDKRDYWKWSSPEQGEKRLQEYPEELVKIFENNNFIWGGKWNHFDILHFEYRPELLIKARISKRDTNGSWNSGIQLEDNRSNEYVKVIDEAFK